MLSCLHISHLTELRDHPLLSLLTLEPPPLLLSSTPASPQLPKPYPLSFVMTKGQRQRRSTKLQQKEHPERVSSEVVTDGSFPEEIFLVEGNPAPKPSLYPNTLLTDLSPLGEPSPPSPTPGPDAAATSDTPKGLKAPGLPLAYQQDPTAAAAAAAAAAAEAPGGAIIPRSGSSFDNLASEPALGHIFPPMLTDLSVDGGSVSDSGGVCRTRLDPMEWVDNTGGRLSRLPPGELLSCEGTLVGADEVGRLAGGGWRKSSLVTSFDNPLWREEGGGGVSREEILQDDDE